VLLVGFGTAQIKTIEKAVKTFERAPRKLLPPSTTQPGRDRAISVGEFLEINTIRKTDTGPLSHSPKD
tara:strand:+ start:4416 stop:4619 length:204 start_codon:yes stop_codon:yes gene_type:complete